MLSNGCLQLWMGKLITKNEMKIEIFPRDLCNFLRIKVWWFESGVHRLLKRRASSECEIKKFEVKWKKVEEAISIFIKTEKVENKKSTKENRKLNKNNGKMFGTEKSNFPPQQITKTRNHILSNSLWAIEIKLKQDSRRIKVKVEKLWSRI